MAATVKKSLWFWSNDNGVPPTIQRVQMTATQGIYIPDSPAYIANGTGTATRTATDGVKVHGFLLDAPATAMACARPHIPRHQDAE